MWNRPAGAAVIAALFLLAGPSSAAVTTVNVSSLAVVVGGKATGTVSGFAPSTAVTIEGQVYTADGSGSVALLAAQLTFDSELSIQFVDPDGDAQSLNATLRNLSNGTVLTAAQLFDLIPDVTEPSSTTVGEPPAPPGGGDPGDGGGTGGGGTGGGTGGGGTGGGGSSGGGGTGGGTAAPTTPASTGAQPTGAVRLADGSVSIPATSVALPHKLSVSRVVFTPKILRSRQPFRAQVTVSDSRGYLVRDALVFLRSVPERRLVRVPERRTGSNGTVTFTLRGTKLLPLKKGARLTIFVRARTSATGAATTATRLVSIRLTSR
jgi:hypothetical protein